MSIRPANCSASLQRSALDYTRAANHLGWKPWTDLEDGLRRTIEWFRAVPVGSRR